PNAFRHYGLIGMYGSLAAQRDLAFLPLATGMSLLSAWAGVTSEVLGRTRPISSPSLEEPRLHPKKDFNLDPSITTSVTPLSPFCNLHHLQKDANSSKESFLIVSPNSGTRATITRDLVTSLLPEHDVHILEWKDPRWLPASIRFDLDDYTDSVREAIRQVPKCNLVGISQSGIPAVVATALMQAQGDAASPSNLIIMGSPINAHLDTHHVNWMMQQSVQAARFGFTADHLFARVSEDLPGAGRLVLAPHMQQGLYAPTHDMKPSYGGEQYLPAEQIRHTLQRIFKAPLLAKGQYEHRGECIDTMAITCGVMSIVGAQDQICSPAQTEALHNITPAAETHLRHREAEAGHYGLVYGKNVPSIATAMKAFVRRPQTVLAA
ncbi:MAG: hypothetical protein WAO98_10455, partial [Alphaproteobacteria bacterium]